MKSYTLQASALTLMATLTLTACDQGPVMSGGPTSTGVITGFGSVFVNGVEYETTDASFSLDGSNGSEDDLAIGMVVKVEGSVNADGTTGNASSISYADELEGIVTDVSQLANGTVEIMGQSVKLDPLMQFESKVATIVTSADLQVNNIVEVSGFSSGDGFIVATRLEVKKASFTPGVDELEVKGNIKNLNGDTFMIGSLTVLTSSSTKLDNIPNDQLADGLYVEVKSTEGINASSQLVASKVELENGGKKGHDGDEGDEMEIEGVVLDVSDLPNSFNLNGQKVLISGKTEFEHGALNQITVQARIKVEGEFNGNGDLVAKKIEFDEAEDSLEYKGNLEAVDTTAGTVTLGGKTFQVTNSTILKDSRDNIRYFKLSDLAVGDYLEIHAYADADGNLIASKLERDDP